MTGGETVTPLMRMLRETEVPAALHSFFSQGRVDKVEVDPDRREWRIYVRLPEPPPSDVLVQVTEHVIRHLQSFVHVVFHFTYERLDLPRFLKSYWPVLVQKLDVPDYIRQWLSETPWTLSGQTLCLHVTQSLLVEWFKRDNCLD